MLDYFHADELRLWVVVHFLVQLGIALRVVMQKRSPGETVAWVVVVFAFPVVGPLMYLLVGELRLGRRRERRFVELSQPMRQWLSTIPERSIDDWTGPEQEFEQLSTLSERILGVPALGGNAVELIGDWRQIFSRLLADIDVSKSTVHLEFYIWNNGGEADRVVDALVRASQRGVTCRVLVDAMGSRKFLKSGMVRRLQDAGVTVAAALPGGLWRLPFVRFDLRLHRKIVVIDGHVGYTGSLNLVDPRYFKRDLGVGEWVDAMVRFQGPAVEALQIAFLTDWFVETGTPWEELQQSADCVPQPRRGDCEVQVMPAGPDSPLRAIEQVLLTAIYLARHEVVLTTPYFLPSESLSLALTAAARRGVNVILVVPKLVDSRLVRFASSAFKGELLEAGVRVALFGDGLLHTKSVTVDGTQSLFGTVNLDPRSFRLNFEILVGVYDPDFSMRLRALQQHYIDRSELMDLETYSRRPKLRQAAENFARLLGPLL